MRFGHQPFSWGWGFPERFGLGGVLCEKCLTKIFNLQRYLGYLQKTLHLNDEFFKNSWLPGGSQTKHSTDYVPGCSYIRCCLDEFVVYLIWIYIVIYIYICIYEYIYIYYIKHIHVFTLRLHQYCSVTYAIYAAYTRVFTLAFHRAYPQKMPSR